MEKLKVFEAISAQGLERGFNEWVEMERPERIVNARPTKFRDEHTMYVFYVPRGNRAEVPGSS